MFFENQLEQKIEHNETKIQELAICFEIMDREINELLEELNVSFESLKAYLQKKENFSDKNWSELQHQKGLLDQKLDLELTNIRNPKKAKNTYNNRCIQPNWIHVR